MGCIHISEQKYGTLRLNSLVQSILSLVKGILDRCCAEFDFQHF